MKFLIITVSILLLASCSQPMVYKPNREWNFEVKRSDSETTDTLKFKIFNENWKLFQKKCKWFYLLINDSSGSMKMITSTTGIIDRQCNPVMEWFFDSEIWMHPPRSAYLRLTEMVPFPWIKFPIEKGKELDWNLIPKSGWEELEGVEVNGTLKVTGKIFYENPVVKDSCWVIEAVGKSDAGNFTGKYYFNEKLGFVYFYYDFVKYKVEIVPFEVNF